METARLKIGGEELILETGKIAKQANGAVMARYGGSVVNATVCCSSEPREGLDYVPVTVDYNERLYAAGKIPGGFLKREARPKNKEILVSRLIDRPMRPLFYKAFGRDLHVVPMTVSTDQINPPDILGMIAAFAAVMVSDIPFNGPVAAVRVGLIDGEYLVNPTFQQLENCELDIIVAGTNEGICMVEGGAHEVSEEQMLEAINKADVSIKEICKFLEDFAARCGKEKLPLAEVTSVLEKSDEIRKEAYEPMVKALFLDDKFMRAGGVREVKAQMREKYADVITDDNSDLFSAIFENIENEVIRKSILEDNKRCDGRKTDEIRPITSEVGLLPRAHGSALFTRGETQSLGVTTLGTVMDEERFDDIDGDRTSNFMLHYNFPPYSVGETGRLMTGRREIGHGHLAHRALEPILPGKDKFPYTIRIVSEIMESNGSSSQATICSGTLSLLDAGVPIKAPVAGIAMGLISESEEKYAVLSDILGEEDHMGDMDFKVAGTEKGITAFQMDIKISHVTVDVMKNAMEQARVGRLHILGEMAKCCDTPNDNVSMFAPKIISLKVEEDKIGAVIGPGGKVIKGISEKTGARVNIDDDGTVTISAKERAGAEEAEKMVRSIVEEPEVGTIYHGTVKRIMDFGAFIEILPGKEGLCHISRISKERVETVSEVLKENQEVDVRLIEVDRVGRLNLSIVDAQDPDWKPRGRSGGNGHRSSGGRR